jgi:hypothetical protein
MIGGDELSYTTWKYLRRAEPFRNFDEYFECLSVSKSTNMHFGISKGKYLSSRRPEASEKVERRAQIRLAQM